MKRFPIVGLAVSLTLLTGTAVAQNSEGLEEIVVTATKREQTLQDVPVAVSVTSVETINKASIQDVTDLASIIPSLRVTTLQTSTNTNFIIRGFGNGANNPGIEPSVGVFIDGVYRSRSAGAIGDLVDVSRVEVLRGPQSTLFGQNASAGVISVITQKPQFETSGLVEATLGNYNQRIIKGKVTAPLTDSLAYSLSGVLNQRDGYFINQRDNTDFNNRDRWDIRGQLLWNASDSVEVRFIADMSKIDEVCCGVSNLVNGPTGALAAAAAGLPQNRVLYPGTAGAGKPFDRAAYINKKPVNLVENSGGSLHVEWEINEAFDLTSITAWRDQKTDFDYDFDFTGALLGTVNRNSGDIETFTQEIRIAFDNGGKVRGLLGAYLMQEDLKYNNEIRIGDHFRSYASLLASAPTGAPTPLFLAGLENTLLNGLPAALRPSLAGSLSSGCTGCSFAAGSFFRSGTGNLITTTQDTEANTVFGQLDFDLTDRLTATVGLAHTSTDKVINFQQSTNEVFSSVNLVTLGYALINGQLSANPSIQQLQSLGVITSATVAGWADRASVANGTTIPCFQPTVPVPGVVLPCLKNDLLGLYPLQFLHPIVPFADRSADSEDTYTIRLAYEASDAVSVYGGVSTGYKATSWNLSRDSKDPFVGTLGTSPLGGAANPWYPRFGSRKAAPEKSTVVELGLKARWDTFAINLAVFDQNIKDFQTNLFSGTGFNLANAGKQSTKGVEIETQWKLSPSWQVDFAGTFLDPKYDSFSGAEGPSGPVDLSGQKPAGIHEQSLSLGVNYLWSMGGVDGFVRTDYLYESKTQIAENVTSSIASREVNTLNASIGFKAAGFDVLVWGRNLNDDAYLLSAFPAVAQAGSFSGYPNQPRTYGVTLRKEF
ncbi:MAG: TonB-dependent receptor [Steroidobacteraceae bacterium]